MLSGASCIDNPLLGTYAATKSAAWGSPIDCAYEETRRCGPRGVRLGEREIQLADGRAFLRSSGVQETASQFVELSDRFATGRDKLEVGKSMIFWIARPGPLDLWTYDIVESEVLRT